MSCSATCLCVFLLYFVISNYQCLKMIPERAATEYFNKLYLETAVINVRRYKRKGDYVVNMSFQSKVVFNNTVTLDIIFYEYLHNEFRRSFIEKRYHLCDFMTNDPYIGKCLREAGLPSCPIPPGKYATSNITYHEINFPYVWPFEKGMAEFIFKMQNNDTISRSTVVMYFKHENPKHKI